MSVKDKNRIAVTLHSSLERIPLGRMKVSMHAQRDLNESRVAKLHAEFDPEHLGYPVVNMRDRHYWIIDGHHRIQAVIRWLGEGWETQNLECRVYRGMTEADEAKMFLDLNNYLAVKVFDKFKVAVTAGKPTETNVQKIVESLGLKIAKKKMAGGISAVGTLVKVYNRSDAKTLERSLRIVRDSFGDSGLEAPVLDGVGHLCQRYNGALDDSVAVDRLSNMRGGVGGLLSRADVLHKQTGNQLTHCVAAAAVEVINAKRGGKKIPSWWSA